MSNESFKPYNLSQHKNDNFHDDDDENSLIIPFNNGGKIGEQTKFDSELQGKEKEQLHDDPGPMDRQKRDLKVVKDLLKEAQMMIDLPEEIILNSEEKGTTLNTKEQKAVQICFAFQNGSCKKQTCKFSHGEEQSLQVSKSAAPLVGLVKPTVQTVNKDKPQESSSSPVVKRALCRDFMKGKCFRTDCKYHHPGDTNLEVVLEVCRDFLKGRCPRKKCIYSHVASVEPVNIDVSDIEICEDFLNGKCNRLKCWLKHDDDTADCKDFLKGNCRRSKCVYKHDVNRLLADKQKDEDQGKQSSADKQKDEDPEKQFTADKQNDEDQGKQSTADKQNDEDQGKQSTFFKQKDEDPGMQSTVNKQKEGDLGNQSSVDQQNDENKVVQSTDKTKDVYIGNQSSDKQKDADKGKHPVSEISIMKRPLLSGISGEVSGKVPKLDLIKSGSEDNSLLTGNSSKPAKVCFAYQNTGRCMKGNSCSYQHTLKKAACFAFLRSGSCSNYECKFDHSSTLQPAGERNELAGPRYDAGEGRGGGVEENWGERGRRGRSREYDRAGEWEGRRREEWKEEEDWKYPEQDGRRDGEWKRDDDWQDRKQENELDKTRPRRIAPGLSMVEKKVLEATTPLANIEYKKQVEKKEEMVKQIVNDLHKEISEYSPEAGRWLSHQKHINMGHCARIEKMKESPVLEGYRNKCEFTIGKDPQTNKVCVGFKLDPGSETSAVGPVHHLRHVPTQMKAVVNLLESHLQSSVLSSYDEGSGEGGWSSALVRTSQNSETMLVVYYVKLDLSTNRLEAAKEDLIMFFAQGGGIKSDLTSLYWAQKTSTAPGTLEHLYGKERITEYVHDIELTVSPRSYLCINTHGAHLLYQTISQTLGLSTNSTLVDICSGSGAIGISLSKWAGQLLGIDKSGDAIVDAKHNVLSNKIANAEYVVGSVEEGLENLIKHATCPEVLAVLDPPRTGLPVKAIRALRAISRISKLVYVSSDFRCSLKTLVDLTRPTSAMFAGAPFMPILVNSVDLFPHTSHFFVVILFVRVSSEQLKSDLSFNLSVPPPSANKLPLSLQISPFLQQNQPLPLYQPQPLHQPPPLQPPPLIHKPVLYPGLNPLRSFNESSLSIEQKGWLNTMTNLYGTTFDRGGWVLSFIKQNHQTALNNLPPLAPPISSPALSNPEVSSLARFPPKINLPSPVSFSPGVKAKLPTPTAACQRNFSDDILPPPPPIIRSNSDHAVNASMQIDNDLPPPPPSISLISSSRCKSPSRSSESTLGRSSHPDISSFRSRSPIGSESPTYSYQRQDYFSPPRSSRQYSRSPPHKSYDSPPHSPCHSYSSPPHKSKHSSSMYDKSSPCNTSFRPFHDRPISRNYSSQDSITPQYFGPPRNPSPLNICSPLRNSSPPLRNSSPPPRNSSPPPQNSSPPLRKASPLRNSSPPWSPPLNSSSPQVLSSDLMSINDQCSSGLSSPKIISSVINTQQLEIGARSDISPERVIKLSPSSEHESTSPTYRLHEEQRIPSTEQDKHNFGKPQTPVIDVSTNEDGDIVPPMPEFPVAPNRADPQEYALYKHKYEVYTAWYEKYGQRYQETSRKPSSGLGSS